MKGERAGAVLEINQDHGLGAAVGGEVGEQAGGGGIVGPAVGEQVAGGGAAVAGLDSADHGEDLPDGGAEVALQALGARGLGEGELGGGVHGAEVILQQRGERQFQQVIRPGGCVDDPEGPVVGEVGGFQPGDDPAGGEVWQWRIGPKKGRAGAWSCLETLIMNTQRYGWPVIIAASLHGALFLISKEPEIVDYTEVRLVPVDRPRPPEEPPAVVPDEPEANEPGPVTLSDRVPPGIPDVLQETSRRDIFTVPVTPYRPTTERVTTLEKFTGLTGDIGGGDGPVGRPSIPGVDQLDGVPRAVAQPSPAYPDLMRRDGINGSVTVAFIVDPEGRVVSAHVARSTHRAFEDSAVRAVLRWRFEPGRQDGRKVSFRMAVPIEFNAAP